MKKICGNGLAYITYRCHCHIQIKFKRNENICVIYYTKLPIPTKLKLHKFFISLLAKIG